MSDRYPGTTTPGLERRFKALQDQLNRLQAGLVKDVARSRTQINVAASDLAEHVAAPNPHPQYVLDSEFESEMAAHLADVTAHGNSLGLTRTGIRLTVPAGYQYISFKILEVEDTLDLEGDAVIL